MPRSVDLGQLDADFKRACRNRDCSISDGLRQAVKQWVGDTNRTEEKPTPVGRLVIQNDDATQYIPHRSHPGIKLVKSVPYNGNETAYIDIEGRKWLMKANRTLIPVATVHYLDSGESKREIIEVMEKDGTRHQIKDGKVVACKKPGENWTVFLDA